MSKLRLPHPATPACAAAEGARGIDANGVGVAGTPSEYWPLRSAGGGDELTLVASDRSGRLRRRLRRGGSKAYVVLTLAAFALGASVSAAAFVGIWRHTATEGAHAKALADAVQRDLARERARVASLTSALVPARVSVAHARKREAALERRLASVQAALARETRSSGRLAATLATARQQLAALDAVAAAIASRISSVTSDLAVVRASLAGGSAGADPGFVATQAGYLVRASRDAQARMSELERQLRAAEAFLVQQ